MFKKEKNNAFDRTEFWKHCIGCGTAGRLLAKSFRYRIIGETFTAGILHDIGKVVLDQHMHEEFMEAIAHAKKKQISLFQTEKEIIGVTHSEVGKILLKYWNLPSHIIEAVEFHHEPQKAKDNPELTAITHFADILCKMINLGSTGDNVVPEIDPFVWELLKKKKLDLNQTDIDKFAFDLNAEIEKSNNFIFTSS